MVERKQKSYKQICVQDPCPRNKGKPHEFIEDSIKYCFYVMEKIKNGKN